MSAPQVNRLAAIGRIDRRAPLRFFFDGKSYQGYAGDTLASALLANGVRLVGRSFKYHRRRGIYSAGPEEPNALVQLRADAHGEPNTRATMIELYSGLVASSQNRWPSLALDLRAINQLLTAFIPAGFYYKTFMWPKKFWPFYERLIRSATGLGQVPLGKDPDHYAFQYAHCDVLVVGSGPAGLSAALAAASSGARVVLADERAALGGSALWETALIDGLPAVDWVAQTLDALRAQPHVRLLARSTVFGAYDHGLFAIAERVTDHLARPPSHLPRQRLLHLRAQRVVLATGSIERPMVFADNDKPGVMLAGAIRSYTNQYAVLPGRRVAIFANNDEAYRSAFDAKQAGADAVLVIDTRREIEPALLERLRQAGIAHRCHAGLSAVHGRSVTAISVADRDGGAVEQWRCDVLGSSGGYSPTLHLYSQAGGKLRYDEVLAAFVPGSALANFAVAGAANGEFTLAGVLAQGFAAGKQAARLTGHDSMAESEPSGAAGAAGLAANVEAFWQMPAAGLGGKRFVDLQEDVCVEDIELAYRENFRSVEHLKRYTTLGMGTDQGKTSNVNGLAILTALRQEPMERVGSTTFRPPYTPVALGLLVGAHTGKHHSLVRRTPLHDWHCQNGALMTAVGQWLRPKFYRLPGESDDAAWRRECRTVRSSVGLVDVGTLGKIDLQGPDAQLFLQRVYCNNFDNLAVGRLRYGLLLREDGIVMDDGVVARLAAEHYRLSTTTVNADKVLSRFEFLLQAVWPELRCHAVSVTEQYAQFALAGPCSRTVLAALLPHCDTSDAALPHLGILQTTLDGQLVTVFRVSFCGECGYELSVDADCGVDLWTRLLACGQLYGIAPYGTETMGVLRVEKGHVAGNEIDGRVTAQDLGLGRLLRKNGGYIGAALAARPALRDSGRPVLVGLLSVDGKTPIRVGSQLLAGKQEARVDAPAAKQGFVSSSALSEFLGHPIALGFLQDGAARLGQELIAASPLLRETVRVRVVPSVFVDPENTRLNA
jgi:sarcosine oxidase subunit alpha